jgi:hypothetical protein
MSINDSSAAEKLAAWECARNQMQRDAEWMKPENFRRLYETEFNRPKFGSNSSSFDAHSPSEPFIYYNNGSSFVTYPGLGGMWAGHAATHYTKVTKSADIAGGMTTTVELAIVYPGDPFHSFQNLGISQDEFIEDFLLNRVSIDSMLKRIHQKMKERNLNG